MGYSLDVDLLLYASNTSSPHHEKARNFLVRCGTQPETMYLSWPTVMGYLRMATHASIFPQPLSPRMAESNMESLMSLPQVVLIAEKDGFWETYRLTSGDMAPRGKLVPDVHLAALLRQHEVRTLFTHDSDFKRFDFLHVVDPLA